MWLLKEWDVVCRALEEGRQTLLARKGGILDEGGRFMPAHGEFFLYPTLFHQTAELQEALKSSETIRLRHHPEELAAGDEIRLRLFCRTVDAVAVTSLSKLRALDDEHIWSRRFLENRFEGGEELGLTLLTVRAYRLKSDIILPMSPAYAGCKSWVDAKEEEEPDLSLLSPVLSDDEFLRRRTRIRRTLFTKIFESVFS